jgi:hypothetical protein
VQYTPSPGVGFIFSRGFEEMGVVFKTPSLYHTKLEHSFTTNEQATSNDLLLDNTFTTILYSSTHTTPLFSQQV